MPHLTEPASSGNPLKWIQQRTLEHHHVVLFVDAFTLAGAAQVIVWADSALEPGTHHRPLAAIADHVGVHHVAGGLLATLRAMLPPALLFLFDVNTEDAIPHVRHRHLQLLVGGKRDQVSVFILIVHAEGGRRPGPQQPLEELRDAVMDGLVAGGQRQCEAADLAGRLLLAQQVGFHRHRRHGSGCGAAGIAVGGRELPSGGAGAGGGPRAAAL